MANLAMIRNLNNRISNQPPSASGSDSSPLPIGVLNSEHAAAVLETENHKISVWDYNNRIMKIMKFIEDSYPDEYGAMKRELTA